MDDLISVVVPFYFGNDFLEDLLVGIECNSDAIGEVIFVVDNGSDNPIIRDDFAVDFRIIASPFLHTNGAGLLRPFGYSLARFRYVMFLDPDDFYICSSLRDYVSIARSRNLAFAFAGALNVDASGGFVGKYVPANVQYSLSHFLKKSMAVYSVSVLLDKYQVPLLVPTTLKKRNDYFAWYYVIKFCSDNSLNWGCVDTFVVKHRFHTGSLTSNIFSSFCWQFVFFRSVGLSLLKSFCYMFPYTINTVFRRFRSGGL